jgi:hypothetical protein
MAIDYYQNDEEFGHFFGPLDDVGLLPQEIKWIEVYVDTRDKQIADAEAGYPFSEHVPNARFQRELRSQLDYRNAKTVDQQRRIVKEIADLAFFDVRDLFDGNGKLIPIQKLPKHVSAAISNVEVITNDAQTSVLKYRFHNKNAALESLARQHNLYKDDNKLDADIKTTDDGSDKETARRLAFLMSKGLHALQNNSEE